MTIREEQRDLFSVPQGYYLAHCISADYALGAGIAKQFRDIYNMRTRLKKDYPLATGLPENMFVGQALPVANVYNLVTKTKAFQKPTYESVRATLEDMRDDMLENHIDKLAMPRIASGLDRLDWLQVKEIIEEVFEDTDIEILICVL